MILFSRAGAENMKEFKAGRYWLLALLAAGSACAPRSTVYTSVVASGAFVVGNTAQKTGLFIQRTSDGKAWRHTGWDKVRAFGAAVDTAQKGKRCFIAAGNGVHMTTDGGANWRITTDWRMTEILGLALDQSDPDTLYAATPYGIFRSTDGAASWVEKNKGLARLPFTSSIIADGSAPAVVYSATEDGVYRSADAGENWARLPLAVGGIRAIAQNPKDAKMLAAGTEDNGIYISRDGGDTWTKCEAGIDHNTFYAVTFDPADPAVIYAGGYVTGVYRSADGGLTWKRFNDGLANLNIHSIAVDPADHRRIYAATLGGGIYRSDDSGGHWRSAGLDGAQVWSVMVEPF